MKNYIFILFVLLLMSNIAITQNNNYSNFEQKGNIYKDTYTKTKFPLFSFGGGFGYAGAKFSESKIGLYGDVAVNISKPIMIKTELSYYSFKRETYDDFKILTFEPSMYYTGFLPPTNKAIVYVGGGFNINYLSGDSVTKVVKMGTFTPDSVATIERENNIKFGLGINLGASYMITKKIGITADYLVRVLFNVDDGETLGDNTLTWGAVRIGIRYYLNKIDF